MKELSEELSDGWKSGVKYLGKPNAFLEGKKGELTRNDVFLVKKHKESLQSHQLQTICTSKVDSGLRSMSKKPRINLSLKDNLPPGHNNYGNYSKDSITGVEASNSRLMMNSKMQSTIEHQLQTGNPSSYGKSPDSSLVYNDNNKMNIYKRDCESTILHKAKHDDITVLKYRMKLVTSHPTSLNDREKCQGLKHIKSPPGQDYGLKHLMESDDGAGGRDRMEEVNKGLSYDDRRFREYHLVAKKKFVFPIKYDAIYSYSTKTNRSLCEEIPALVESINSHEDLGPISNEIGSQIYWMRNGDLRKRKVMRRVKSGELLKRERKDGDTKVDKEADSDIEEIEVEVVISLKKEKGGFIIEKHRRVVRNKVKKTVSQRNKKDLLSMHPTYFINIKSKVFYHSMYMTY